MKSFNLLLLITVVLAVISFIVKQILDYLSNKLLSGVDKNILGILENYRKKKVENFYSIINSKDFKVFADSFLRNYYGEEFFSKSKGSELIPVFSVRYSGDQKRIRSIRDYDKLANKDSIIFSFNAFEHQDYKKSKYYKQYFQLVQDHVKKPDRPGFMLKKIIINEQGMTQFDAYIGTFGETVFTNHVLDYELYKIYMRGRKRPFKKLKKEAIIRNNIHASVDVDQSSPDFKDKMRKSLLSGEGRKSLLGVQMLVLIKDKDDYNIKIIRRSKQVAIAPERFQLVPSGGFEIFNDSQDGYSKFELEDNYSPGCAIFREYLEELFGEEECEGRGRGSVNEVLLKDERIQEIEKMLRTGEAEFKFLGSVMDLLGLRHELSFVLVIHQENYIENIFIGNEESQNGTFISNVTLHNFEEKKDLWDDILWQSAAMWNLFKETDLYKSLITK